MLANISTGSYFAWHHGDTPLLLANATVPGGVAPLSVAVLQGVGPGPTLKRYVQDLSSSALLADGAWEIADVVQTINKIAAATGVATAADMWQSH